MPTATRLVAMVLAGCAACAHAGPETSPHEAGTDAGIGPAPPRKGAESSDPVESTLRSGTVPGTVPGAPGAANAVPGTDAANSATTPGSFGTQQRHADRARVVAARAATDALIRSQAEALWQTWTTGAPLDLASAAGSLSKLLSPGTLKAIRTGRDSATGSERRALSLLYAFVLGEHLAASATAIRPPPVWVEWNGRRIAGSRVTGVLATEPDPRRRAALHLAWAEAERRRSASTDARWLAIGAAARRLGYETLTSVATELRGEPLHVIERLATAVLNDTDVPYRTLMRSLASERLGNAVTQLRGCDLPRLFTDPESTAALPPDRVSAAARQAFSGMGLDIAGMPGLLIDAAARPRKDTRTLTLPVEVPGSVRITYVPTAGASALRSLLHELGVAAYYANVNTPVAEFNRLGNVLPAMWGFLFEDLAADPEWLAESLGIPQSLAQALVRVETARRLHEVRVLAGRVLVETARERSRSGDELRAIVERVMTRGLQVDEMDLFLTTRDPLLESAETLEAMLLASQVANSMTAAVASPWWRSPLSRQRLAEVFSAGSRLTPREVAQRFGSDDISERALAQATSKRALAVEMHPDTSP